MTHVLLPAARNCAGMSYCKREGDHRSVFLVQDDLAKPEAVSSLVAEEEEEEEEFGVILPNGEINWDCPCLGGMPQGPCGQQFKDAFSCFHYSTAEEKGSDCIDTFKAMQECFQRYPDLYKDEDEDTGEVGEEKGETVAAVMEAVADSEQSLADDASRLLTSSSADAS